MRTPLNGVIGMLGLLSRTRLDGAQRAYAEAARSSAEHLLGLVNDLLDYARLEAGKLEFDARPRRSGSDWSAASPNCSAPAPTSKAARDRLVRRPRRPRRPGRRGPAAPGAVQPRRQRRQIHRAQGGVRIAVERDRRDGRQIPAPGLHHRRHRPGRAGRGARAHLRGVRPRRRHRRQPLRRRRPRPGRGAPGSPPPCDGSVSGQPTDPTAPAPASTSRPTFDAAPDAPSAVAALAGHAVSVVISPDPFVPRRRRRPGRGLGRRRCARTRGVVLIDHAARAKPATAWPSEPADSLAPSSCSSPSERDLIARYRGAGFHGYLIKPLRRASLAERVLAAAGAGIGRQPGLPPPPPPEDDRVAPTRFLRHPRAAGRGQSGRGPAGHDPAAS
jgi:hypothetical protein